MSNKKNILVKMVIVIVGMLFATMPALADTSSTTSDTSSSTPVSTTTETIIITPTTTDDTSSTTIVATTTEIISAPSTTTTDTASTTVAVKKNKITNKFFTRSKNIVPQKKESTPQSTIKQVAKSLVVVGNVSAINGNHITLTYIKNISLKNQTGTSSQPMGTTTHEIDASDAVIMKNDATSSVSNILIGDTILVQGITSDKNSIVAKTIRDITAIKTQHKQISNNKKTKTTIDKNTQSFIVGTISVINGSTITITNKVNGTYSIDTTNAKIVLGNKIVSIQNVTVGDNIMVQGIVKASSVVASKIVDQGQKINSIKSPTTQKTKSGVLKNIGGLIKNLFKF